jgi:hypothetical protein
MDAYFKNQIVRDLAWVISSPSVFNKLPTKPNLIFFDEDLFSSEYSFLQNFLFELDNDPEQLLYHIKLGNNTLLGKYYESLVEFWFEHSARFDLISKGIQVENGRETIGEFDFILKENSRKEFIHLETVGKFYLSLKNSEDWTNFIGPNPNDNLQKKMDKLLENQIYLGKTEDGKQILADLGINKIHSAIMIKGYIFYHLNNFVQNKIVAPVLSNNKHAKGWWIKYSELSNLNDLDYDRWIVLKRQNWISKVVAFNNEVWGLNTLSDYLNKYFRSNNYPLLIAGLAEKDNFFTEMSRGFIVSNHWPDLNYIH